MLVMESEAFDPEANFSVLEFTHTWAVENFYSRRHDRIIVSPSFSPKSCPDTKWCLEVYPKGENKHSKGFVSLHLRLVSHENDQLPAKFTISILGADQLPMRTIQQNEPILFECGKSTGFERFISRAIILENPSQYFPKNRLFIRCIVSTLVKVAELPGSDSLEDKSGQELSQNRARRMDRITKTEEHVTSPVFLAPPDTCASEPTPGAYEENLSEFSTANSIQARSSLLAREFSLFNQAAHRLLAGLKELGIEDASEIRMKIKEVEVVWPLPANSGEAEDDGDPSGCSYTCGFACALDDIEPVATDAISSPVFLEIDRPGTPAITYSEVISIELNPDQSSTLANLCEQLELLWIRMPSIVDRWQLHRAYPDAPSIAKNKSTTFENSISGKTGSLLESLNACAGRKTETNLDEPIPKKNLNLRKTPNFNRNGVQYSAARVQNLAAMKVGFKK